MEVIVPAAGLSTRFPGMRPKYLLFDYTGTMMLERAVAPYLGKHRVTIGILKEHDEAFKASELIRKNIDHDINIVILPERTKGPADTIHQIIAAMGDVDDESGLLIKDCDSFFEHDVTEEGSYVCISNIADHEVLKRLAAKSFVITNEHGIITSIIEKKVVSDKFCVGGYKFDSVALFRKAFAALGDSIPEVFISHIIQECLFNGHTFVTKAVSDYVDVGTAEDWFDYNDRPVIFCDIDGTIVKAQSRNSYAPESAIPLPDNVKRLLELEASGAQLIFTTARPLSAKDDTATMLRMLGFQNFELLTGLQVSRRILINDYNAANPFPRAEAINIKRDSDNLRDFL